MNVLEMRRLRAVKITLVAVAVLIAVLAIWQFVEQQLSTAHVSDYLEQPQSAQDAEPFALASQKVEFIEASKNGNIYWYQSSSTLAETAMLIDQALCGQGWQALPSEQLNLQSYSYPGSANAAGGFALVSFTEQQSGCTVVINLT